MSVYNLPSQKLSYKQKTTGTYRLTKRPWGELNVDGCINGVFYRQNFRRSSQKIKQRNYNLLNNKVDEMDFEYVTKPFEICDLKGNRLDLKFPATIQPYDVVSPYFRLLDGEESKRFFSPVIRVINEDAVSEKEENEKQVVLQALEQILTQAIQGQGQDNEQQETPEQILKYHTYNIQDLREKQANDLIEYYKRFLNLEQVFQKGWKDFLVAGEEIYRIEEVCGEPKVTRVNPIEVFFVLPNNTDYIDNADIIVEHNRMSLNQIIDEFYDVLKPGQIDELEQKYSSTTTNVGYTEFAPVKEILDGLPLVDSINTLSVYSGSGLDVYRTRWKSFKKIGSLHYIDEQGKEQEIDVDETFKVDSNDKSMWIEWFWVTEYWEGIRIDRDIYLNIRPVKFRFADGDNLSACSSGYVGTICDGDNSQSTSLMDRLVPWFYFYLIMMYRLELLIATNYGKIVNVDTSAIPTGMSLHEYLYYATAMKFSFTDSYSEGMKGERKGQFNQADKNKSIDAEAGNAIQHHISVLSYIEKKIQDTSGITPQRLGAIQNDELVGNTERAVVQSSHITEGYFFTHNYTKIRVLKHLLEVAKETLTGKSKRIQYITDDIQNVIATIDGDKLSSADYGITISNSAKDQEALAAIKQLLQAAIQNDKIQMSQVIDIYNTPSIAVLKNAFKVAEERQQQQAQAQEKAQQDHEKALQDYQVQLQQDQQDWQSQENELDREARIEEAEIKSFIGQQDLDVDKDGVPDPVEFAKLALDRSRLEFEKTQAYREHQKEEKKLSLEKDKLKSQERMKDKDNQTKIRVARMKPKPAKK